MSDRQFAAAHDRLLEPPDGDVEETWDEMDFADVKRQNQIDHEDWQAELHRQRQENQS